MLLNVADARLLYVGHTSPDATWRMDAHAHAHWEFVYFLRGCGRVDTPGTTLHPQQYFLAAYPPGLSHAERADPLEPEDTIFLGVDVPGAVPAEAPLLLSDPQGELRWLAEHLLAEYDAGGASPLALAYTHAFLHLVARSWADARQGRPDVVEAAVQYLHANYTRRVTLRELAGVGRVSPTHLAHRFTARLGVSPMRYLQGVRLEAGKRLLATTELSVQEVARHVGFDDPLYFSRVLKRAIGASPTGYRHAVKNATTSMPAAAPSIPKGEA
jgi:AraC-like DNA-binding protein